MAASGFGPDSERKFGRLKNRTSMNAHAISTVRSWSPFGARTSLAKIAGQIGLISILCLSILAPAIPVTSDFSLKIEQPMTVAIVVIYGVLLLSGLVRPIRLNGMYAVATLMAFSIALSMWYGSQVLGHNLILRDYFEIPKMFLLATYFTIGYEAELSEEGLQRMLNFLSLSLLLICIYGWGQFFDFSFTYKMNPYYAGSARHELGLEHYHRVYSTMGNPNVLGQIMSWCLVLYTMAFLFKVGSKVRNVGTAFLCLITSVMTGSRYSLLCSILGFVLIVVAAGSALRRRASQLLLVLFVLLPLFVWTFMTVEMQHQSTFERFAALKHPMEVDSLQERFNKVWIEATFYFEKSPILGNGPAKRLFLDMYDDCEYLGILKRYGIFGFLPYSAFFLFPLYLLWRGMRSVRGRAGPVLEEIFPLSSLATRFGFAMVLMAIFMNIGMTTLYGDALQGFTFLWFGLSVRCARTVTEASARISPAPATARPRGFFGRERLR
jgi:O-antigen ligase